MPRAKTNGIEIDYDTLGSAEDPAILLVILLMRRDKDVVAGH